MYAAEKSLITEHSANSSSASSSPSSSTSSSSSNSNGYNDNNDCPSGNSNNSDGVSVEFDVHASFYVGDAAGRIENDKKRDTDRAFAENARVKFYTPEQFFLKDGTIEPFQMQSFDPKSYFQSLAVAAQSSSYASSSSSQIGSSAVHSMFLTSSSFSLWFNADSNKTISSEKPVSKPEIVLFVGPPAIGKSSFYKKRFAPLGHTHVNMDLLKTPKKCMDAVRESIQRGVSVVVDNTNGDAAKRREYISIGQQLGAVVRCIHFHTNSDDKMFKSLVFHLNRYRSFTDPSRSRVPDVAIHSFFKYYQPPSVNEGFQDILNVIWSPDMEGKTDLERALLLDRQ
jgi:bifunctional polynucleotide phosphatase/kinase